MFFVNTYRTILQLLLPLKQHPFPLIDLGLLFQLINFFVVAVDEIQRDGLLEDILLVGELDVLVGHGLAVVERAAALDVAHRQRHPRLRERGFGDGRGQGLSSITG